MRLKTPVTTKMIGLEPTAPSTDADGFPIVTDRFTTTANEFPIVINGFPHVTSIFLAGHAQFIDYDN